MNGIIIAIVNMIGITTGGTVPPPMTGDIIAENGVDYIVTEATSDNIITES